MRVIDLAIKDLMQIYRDWKAALFLVIMPVAFTLLFGFVFSGTGGEQDPRLPVGIVDQDGGSVFSTYLLDILETSDAIRPVILEGGLAEAEKQMGEEELAAAIVVPAGYGQGVLAGGSEAAHKLLIMVDLDSGAGQIAQSGIQAATARLMGAVQTTRLTSEAYEAQGGTADSDFQLETLAQAVAAWQDPPLTVASGQSDANADDGTEETTESSDYAHSSAGIMVQFALAGLIGAAEILVLERKAGALQRLLTTPITRFEIILGHYLAMFAMVLLQLVILVAFGQLVLNVDYMAAPVATTIMILVTALWAASMGLLIGTFARTEDQVIIFTLITMMVLSALGGAWIPLEFTGQTFQTVGHLTPVAWAIDGFENIVVRGQGLESVWLPALILMAFAVVFFSIGVWRFKFE